MGNTTTTSKSPADDVVVRRLYARGTWKLDSVAHFGGDEAGIADMCLLRDDDNKPFIPAASIAGAARSFLARKCLTWTQYKEGLTREPRKLKNLFGGADTEDTMSTLIVSDAASISEKVNRTIRDGVSIDIKSGTAKTGAKYDVEVVERGTEFRLEMECIIRHGDDNAALTQLFLAILHAFQQGDLRLGARTRRGYGRGKVESWEIRDLRMDCPEDVMAWLRDDPWPRPKSSLTPEALPTDQRSYFSIEADFELRTSLLIRSVSGEPEAPDMVHLQSVGKPVVPGTSFAGALRHRATLIANTIGFPEKAVEKMFGFVHQKNSNNSQEPISQASRIRIEERLVKNVDAKTRWQNRIAIDRFTGGVVDGALFNEKPVYPRRLKDIPKGEPKKYHLRLTLTLEEPDPAEIGLLLLTLRDFWCGHTALGGETSNGRGTLRGIEARLMFKSSDSSDTKDWKFLHKDNRMTVDEGDAAFLKDCVAKAQCPSDCPPAGSRRPEKREGDR